MESSTSNDVCDFALLYHVYTMLEYLSGVQEVLYLQPSGPDSRPCRLYLYMLSNSYTMGCPPVRGDNPQALASGLSYVEVDKHGITTLYHLHQCRPRRSKDNTC